MSGLKSFRAALLASMGAASVLFPVSGLVASPSATAVAADATVILMGVAVAAPTQTALQQSTDRQALKRRLNKLIDGHMGWFSIDDINDQSRIVRVVFDVDSDGRAANVRVGKRSGSWAADSFSRSMVSHFKELPGGKRHRVCAVLQYGRLGQDSNEVAYVKALKDAINSAVTDMRAGRDGPNYDRQGRVIVET